MTFTPDRRYLTLHERWFLMRRNTGHQFTITLLITYPDIAAVPQSNQLRFRTVELQDRFRQLNCRVRDAKTRKPYWEELPNRSEIVNEKRYESGGEEEILAVEQGRMEKEDFEGGRPLWQITPYVGPNRAYLAMSALHELIDGRGLLWLLHNLLAPDVQDLPYERLSTVATYPDTIDLKPSWRFLLPFALQERVYPWLPQFITSRLATPTWPMGQVGINPLTLPGKIIITDLPSDLVNSLKSLGKFHGVPTLTPVLFTGWLVAMWSVIKAPALSATIAVDERNPTLGHSICTGLYHASHLYSLEFPSSFWNAARNVARHIAHPTSLNIARMRMGMIAWVPDGEVPAARSADNRPTAWEDWQLQRNENLDPYVCSASFSNLGRVDLPDGVEGIVVASSPSIGDPPIKLVLTGTKKGIKVAFTFRDGDILMEAQMREMATSWVGLLRRLTGGKGEDILLDETFEAGIV